MRESDKAKLTEKILFYIQKGYLIFTYSNHVRSYIDYIAVPKGLEGIMMVPDGYSCGLNSATFASIVWLLMSKTMTRLLSFGYKVVDMDVRKIFPNFPLHHSLRNYLGIDLPPLNDSLKRLIPEEMKCNKRLSASWSRLWFGLRSSPECALYLAEEFV